MADAVRRRLDSVDVVRGVIIILMALDHSRDFFGDLAADPTNLGTTTSPLFFTRWITHFCAPAFFLLTGASAYLAQERFTKPELARFLVSRGLWLIFLELTVMRFALQFNLDYAMSARCSARPTWRTFLSAPRQAGPRACLRYMPSGSLYY